MKRRIARIACLFMVIVFMASACTSTTLVSTPSTSSRNMPPGQAKKTTGSQSAKAYAPGQQKKSIH